MYRFLRIVQSVDASCQIFGEQRPYFYHDAFYHQWQGGPRLCNAAAGVAATAGFNPNAWVSIAASGVVTMRSAPAEMGQGIMTGLPLCLAEVLDADWSLVRVEQSPGIRLALNA
jgi:xanthine dehydrogenase molybdopterin-binding subunit B